MGLDKSFAFLGRKVLNHGWFSTKHRKLIFAFQTFIDTRAHSSSCETGLSHRLAAWKREIISLNLAIVIYLFVIRLYGVAFALYLLLINLCLLGSNLKFRNPWWADPALSLCKCFIHFKIFFTPIKGVSWLCISVFCCSKRVMRVTLGLILLKLFLHPLALRDSSWLVAFLLWFLGRMGYLIVTDC